MGALTVWLGGFAAVVLTGDESVDTVAEAIVLALLFAAGWVIGAVAWLVSGAAFTAADGAHREPTNRARLVSFGMCWIALLVGAGVPSALRAMDRP